MLRLLNTWNGVFPLMKLNKINAQIQSLIPSELNIPKPQVSSNFFFSNISLLF